MRLKDKVAIITGSARGIGQATALKFAAEGARVVVCDLDRKAVDEVVAQITASGGQAIGFTVNVVEKASIAAMVKGVTDKYGRIDVLVNNAGIVDDAMFRKMTDEQFDRVIDINLKGTFNCARAVVEIMIAQGAGVILNASSVVGIYGNFGQTNYAASKFAVIGMAKTWARELGRKGIRANAVCPGFVETTILKSIPEKVMQAMIDRVPLGRLAKPEEIANTYAFLASDEASYINGAVIEVSGGATI
jgi:3-oxoacyl-[acyl-carrier protein] reductase